MHCFSRMLHRLRQILLSLGHAVFGTSESGLCLSTLYATVDPQQVRLLLRCPLLV